MPDEAGTLVLDATATAKRNAGRQYARAVERHFDEAHRLVVAGKPDAAERIAVGAAELRMRARYELRS